MWIFFSATERYLSPIHNFSNISFKTPYRQIEGNFKGKGLIRAYSGNGTTSHRSNKRVTVDETFGHVLMFGMGGVFVEVLGDVSFRSIPLDEEDAK
jgi:hypothetical protein